MNLKEIEKKQRQGLKDEKESELSSNSELIDDFIRSCKSKGINLSEDNINYVQTIGIVAEFPNLVELLNSEIKQDKEGLINVNILENEFIKKKFSGYYYGDNYIVMADYYFRRGYSKTANFAPSFLDVFWKYKNKNNDTSLSIDSNRVRINLDNRMYMEFDTWYGAKFLKNINEISDGVVKLRTPLHLSKFEVDFFFGGNYSLDVFWYSKKEKDRNDTKKIKIFQSEEFKTEDHFIFVDSIKYFPVRYIHAEFDIAENVFRHFDGALHFYKEDEYFARRDSDFNFNQKNDFKLKTLSKKLFKINGKISIDDWIELTSHFMAQNPLIFEYFEGEFPTELKETLELLKKKD